MIKCATDILEWHKTKWQQDTDSTDGMTLTSLSGVVSMVTCGSSDRGFGRVHAIAMDGLGAAPPLLGPTNRSRFNDGVHVLHQFQLLPPEIFLLDELPPGLVFLLPGALLLCF